MSEKQSFEVDCPNLHNQTVKYGETEFENILRTGTLVFHCNTCDTDWSPSGKEIAAIRKQFHKHSPE